MYIVTYEQGMTFCQQCKLIIVCHYIYICTCAVTIEGVSTQRQYCKYYHTYCDAILFTTKSNVQYVLWMLIICFTLHVYARKETQ